MFNNQPHLSPMRIKNYQKIFKYQKSCFVHTIHRLNLLIFIETSITIIQNLFLFLNVVSNPLNLIQSFFKQRIQVKKNFVKDFVFKFLIKFKIGYHFYKSNFLKMVSNMFSIIIRTLLISMSFGLGSSVSVSRCGPFRDPRFLLLF